MQIPYRRTGKPLNLLVDSTAVTALGGSDRSALK
ncbi:hypothetical protein M2324_001762 [Rhodovulum sulfidophilum]|nr:hypothetical protein [Rhodovulum sulfidophilum]